MSAASQSTTAPPRILGVFAHPDDESFCAGGTLARYVEAGAEAMVVSATRGDAGQIRDARIATRRTLGQVRERELHAACRELGVQHALCLGFGDGTLKDVDQDILAGRVVEIIRSFRPDVVITFGQDGAYGHPDHIAISAATTAACAWAGDAGRYPTHLANELAPHRPAYLYHSHFPRSRMLLMERLVEWLIGQDERFMGSAGFVRALLLLAEESTTLRYASDHVDVQWYPSGFYIIEQGETATQLYHILSGEVQVFREEADGKMRPLERLGVGAFFGEQGLAHHQPRNAHVVAEDNVTCLVFSLDQPTAFAGRGEQAHLDFEADTRAHDDALTSGATACIDVGVYVERKIRAIGAHRTQYPIEPEMFPLSMLREMMGREYFVQIHPPRQMATELY